ncbi:hypothetical protein MP213Fo_10890 [Pseudochrobactrum sp. MP213Fo]
MALCVLSAAGLLRIATTSFMLSWTHSVEKTPWQEDWHIGAEGFVLKEARIQGSGAGMEPPEDAVLRDGWYHYVPKIPPRREITLAASGETVSGWTLCAQDRCYELGMLTEQPIKLLQCP